MNDERLTGLLGSLRHERMDRIADDKIRARLENAWSARAERRSFSFRVRRLAPMLATVALFVGLGAATMSAAGDSALYGFRIAAENASIAFHFDPEDRNEFIVSLLDQRQAEAARLEATGNAAAASKARQIERDTLAMVRAVLPQPPDVDPAPVLAPTETPTPSPTATPTLAPTVAPTATATPARTASPRPTATPTRTPSPTPTPTRTATPPPTPTGTPFAVLARGTVKNADGTLAANVCVRLETTNPTCLYTSKADGTWSVTFSGKINQTVTFIFTRQDGTTLWKGYVTVLVKGSIMDVPTVKLAKG